MSKFRKFMTKNWKIITNLPVEEIMNRDIKKLNGKDTVDLAVKKLAKHGISGVLIVDSKNNPTGIISEGDLIKKVFSKDKDPKNVKLKEIMTKKLKTISPKDSIGKASNIMKKYNISKLPVFQKDKLVGYITKTDLIQTTNKMYLQNRHLLGIIFINVFLLIIIVVLIIQLLKC